MRNKHILFIGQGLGNDGSSKMLRMLVDNLDMYFKETFTLTYESDRKKLEKSDKIKALYFETFNVFPVTNSIYDKVIKYIRMHKTIKKTVYDNDIDVVIVFTSSMMTFTSTALINWKGNLIGSERGDPVNKRKIMRVLSKITFKGFDKLVFQTEEVKSFYGNKIAKISKVIPNPYVSNDNKVKQYKGKRDKVIVTAGRLSQDKGFDILIKAFSTIHTDYENYTLEIYGDGPEKENLINLIFKLNLENKIKLHGFVDNVAKEIRKSSVFVLPSKSEGIPNVLLEAMGIGMPCVATNCSSGGPKLLFDQNRRGILVEVNNISSLAEGIKKVISNPDLAGKISNNAMEVKEVFDLNNIVKEWIEFIL